MSHSKKHWRNESKKRINVRRIRFVLKFFSRLEKYMMGKGKRPIYHPIKDDKC